MSDLTFDLDGMVEFLVALLKTPSPTGYHVEAIPLVQRWFESLAFPDLTMRVLPKGALVITIPGEAANAPVGLAAHVDTLGLMVKEIRKNGRLKMTNIGGIQWGGIEGEGVTIRAHDNRRYRGTVLPVNPSGHVNLNLSRQERNADLMEVRIDARTSSAGETRALGIDVGDFIFVDSRVEVTDTGFIRGRHLDNKAGVAVIWGALKALKAAGLRPTQDTTVLIANYEEVGHGGAAGLPDNLAELLTIDMGAMGDGQNSDEYSVSLCVKDSGGPYHFDMNNKLRWLAAAYDIPLKADIYPSYASDGMVYWRSGGQGRVGLIGPGVESSHAYERTHTDSLRHTAHLIARYLREPVDE